jgi:hypothetical protein
VCNPSVISNRDQFLRHRRPPRLLTSTNGADRKHRKTIAYRTAPMSPGPHREVRPHIAWLLDYSGASLSDRQGAQL